MWTCRNDNGGNDCGHTTAQHGRIIRRACTLRTLNSQGADTHPGWLSNDSRKEAGIAGNTSREGRTVIEGAFAVLGSFSDDRPEQTLGMIQHATGLPSATTHRLVSELVDRGALQRVGRGKYSIGLRLWQLGSLAPAARNLRDVALPFLQDLFEVTHEVVHLAVLDDYQALYLERLMARPVSKVQSRVAKRLPLHATGPGKVLLAYQPQDFINEVISRGLRKRAAKTITNPDALRRALAEIRVAGYCLTRDEITDGSSSVAAPIHDLNGLVIAAISVVVPTETDLHSCIPAVRIAALGIDRAMRLPATAP